MFTSYKIYSIVNALYIKLVLFCWFFFIMTEKKEDKILLKYREFFETNTNLWGGYCHANLQIIKKKKTYLKKTCFCLFSFFFRSNLMRKTSYIYCRHIKSKHKIGKEPTTCGINQTNIWIKIKVKTRIYVSVTCKNFDIKGHIVMFRYRFLSPLIYLGRSFGALLSTFQKMRMN